MTGIAPVIPQVPAGWGPFQSDFATWVTTPIASLATAPAFRGDLAGGQSIPASTPTLLRVDTIAEDPYGGWSATATAAQPAWSWLCPAGCSGWYEVSVCALCTAETSSPAALGALVYVSGALWQYGSLGWAENTTTAGASGSVLVPLLGGSDYVQLYLFSTYAVSTPTGAAGRYPGMEIAWIST